MKILSIDVGIKNLAFCLFELSAPDELSILKWNVISLATDAPTYPCGVLDKSKCCGKPAKFTKNNVFFCLKHAKKTKRLFNSYGRNEARVYKETKGCPSD